MKKHNRILVTLLIITMIMSSMPSVYGAEESATTENFVVPDGYVLADFSKGAEAWTNGNMTTVETPVNWDKELPDGSFEQNTHMGLLKAYAVYQKDENGQFVLDGNGKKIKEVNEKQGRKTLTSALTEGKLLDFSNINYINFWIYLPKKDSSAHSTFAFIGRKPKADGSGIDQPFFTFKIVHDFEGWRMISFKKSDGVSYNNKAIPSDWTIMDQIWVNIDGGWLADSPEGTEAYFGKIWATAEKPVAEIVSESHSEDEENVTADRNEISFILDDNIFGAITNPNVKVQKAAIGKSFEDVPDTDYSFNYEGNTVKITFTENLIRKSKYKITLDGIITASGKSFSVERNFTTEGYTEVTPPVDNAENMVADFTTATEASTWSRQKGDGNIYCLNDTEAPENSKYSGTLGKLETHYNPNAAVKDETKPSERYLPYYAEKKWDTPQDWSNADAFNMLIYSEEAVPNSRFEVNILTSGKYYIGYISGNFEGWRLYTIPIYPDKASYSDKNKNSLGEYAYYAGSAAGDPTWSAVTGVQLATASWKLDYPAENELSKIHIAHIWTSKNGDENPVTSTSITNGECDVPVETTSFEMSFSEKILPISSQIADVTLLKHDGTGFFPEESPSVTVEDATVKFSFGTTLEKNTKYRLDIKNLYLSSGKDISQTIEFTTVNSEVHTTKPEIEEDDSGELTVTINTKNESSSERKVTVIADLYDTDRNFVKTVTQSETVPAGASDAIVATFGNVFDLLDEAGAEDIFNYTVEAYAVDASDNNNPLLRRKQVYKSDGTTEDTEYLYTPLSNGNVTMEAQILDKTLVIKGNVGAPGMRGITLTIEREPQAALFAARAVLQPEPVLITQIDSNADGTFYAEIDISDVIADISDNVGRYSVSANAFNATTSSASNGSFFFADSTMKKSIIENINDSANATAVNTYLQSSNGDNAAALGLSGSDYTHISNVLYEKKVKSPFTESATEFNKVATLVADATASLNELNTKNWIYLAEYISTEKDLVIHNNAFDTTYFTLSPETQNAVCGDVSELRPFASFNDFRDKLKTVTAPYLSTSGTGDNNNNNNYTDTGGGGGGGTKVSDKTLPSAPVTPLEPGEVFSDLGAHEWAKDDILYLYEKGIVSGVSNNSFKPESNVKREEFVKMLVEALNIPISGNNSGFFDSANGAWYEKYLCAAKESGIVNGRADGSFGVGNTITRQDMAVMMHRALSVMNKLPNAQNETQSFSDSNDISSYAIDAVKLMQGCGLINGMGDNTFAPHKEATRAQAAVIIRRILSAIEKGGVN